LDPGTHLPEQLRRIAALFQEEVVCYVYCHQLFVMEDELRVVLHPLDLRKGLIVVHHRRMLWRWKPFALELHLQLALHAPALEELLNRRQVFFFGDDHGSVGVVPRLSHVEAQLFLGWFLVFDSEPKAGLWILALMVKVFLRLGCQSCLFEAQAFSNKVKVHLFLDLSS
jgi:hypothetical protein